MEANNVQKWHVGEMVLAPWNDCYYKARIVEMGEDENKRFYKIHYEGWPKDWDQYLTEKDTLEWKKYTTEAYEEAKAQIKTMKKAAAKRGNVSKEQSAEPDGVRKVDNNEDNIDMSPVAKRRNTTPNLDEKTADSSEEKEFGLHLPDPLRKLVVDDFNTLTNLGQWPKLPAKVTISQIIKEFCLVVATMPAEKKVVLEFANGKKTTSMTTKQELNAYGCMIEALFNSFFVKYLLVPTEKLQAKAFIAHVMESNEKYELAKPFLASEFYGLPYLLRLFTKINHQKELLNDECKSYSFLRHSSEFLKYLVERMNVYYDKEGYIATNPALLNQNPE